jgi:hypothetical protein
VCIAEAIVTFIGLECSHLTNLISAWLCMKKFVPSYQQSDANLVGPDLYPWAKGPCAGVKAKLLSMDFESNPVLIP